MYIRTFFRPPSRDISWFFIQIWNESFQQNRNVEIVVSVTFFVRPYRVDLNYRTISKTTAATTTIALFDARHNLFVP